MGCVGAKCIKAIFGQLLVLGLLVLFSVDSYAGCKTTHKYYARYCGYIQKTCVSYNSCYKVRSECNVNLSSKQSCEAFDSCIEADRIEKIKGIPLDATSKNELLKKERCSYAWVKIRNRIYCKLINNTETTKLGLDILSCPGYVNYELTSDLHDDQFTCAAAKGLFKTQIESCKKFRKKLDKSCKNTKYYKLVDENFDCPGIERTLPEPKAYKDFISDLKKTGSRRVATSNYDQLVAGLPE